MSNALVIYEKVGDPVKFSTDLAKATAALVGCSVDQGAAVALTCLCEGITPLEFQRTYHLIQGKPSMRADAMLAKFVAMGGKYKIVERSAKRAAIEMLDADGGEFADEFTWEQAKESRWPWKDWKQPEAKRELKDNWATPTDQKAMLWARLVSDSLRAFAPQIVAGIYTPEEMQDADIVGSVVKTNEAKRPTAVEAMAAAGSNGHVEAADEAASDGVVDADIIPEADDPVDETLPQGEGYATRGHIEKILALSSELNAPLDQLLAKRGVSAVRSLPVVQAQDLIDKLQAKKKQRSTSLAKN